MTAGTDLGVSTAESVPQETRPVQTVGPSRQDGPDRGRAYCGEAHGASWTVPRGDPPAAIDVPVRDGSVRYRLVRRPRNGRPAKDYHGSYLYIPELDQRPGDPSNPTAKAAST